MTPERWAQIKQVCGVALEKPESERPKWLDTACGGDRPLRAEVDRLLAQGEESLESPAPALLAATMPQFRPGDMLSRYRVEAKIGEGGMGVVYRAYDAHLRRPVALKVLRPERLADAETTHTLMREARAASALTHPNIVSIYEVGSQDGVEFVAMEYVEGKPLSEIIPARSLPVRKLLDYAVQIADALARAHGSGVIHRDLKPGNIMVSPDGHVKLLDFGLARHTRLKPDDTTLTGGGEISGTPAYMSPEQARGQPLDHRSDQFSFGLILLRWSRAGRPSTGPVRWRRWLRSSTTKLHPSGAPSRRR